MKSYIFTYKIFRALFALVILFFLPMPSFNYLAFADVGQADILQLEQQRLKSETGSGGRAPGDSSYNQPIKIPNPLKINSISELIDRIVNWLIFIGAPILTFLIIIGAFQILTAAGNEEQVTAGRKTITYAVIGYALLLISKGVTMIIAQLFGVG